MNTVKTANCEPTLNDSQVWEFCKQGFLMLEGVVPNEVNSRVYGFIEAHGGQHSSLLKEDWFVENVFLNLQAAGAVRSLLGNNFALPIGMANHRVVCPAPAQNWHKDGGSRHGPELNHLQVFYYPQDCALEMGPTEVLPGSHFLFSLQSWMGHYGSIRGGVKTAASAGSIFITAYPIWHRRSASTAKGLRNMLKYCYWRMLPSQRDWILEADFNPMQDNPDSIKPPRQQCRAWYDAAEMFYWLCGKASEFHQLLGGEGWPHGYPVAWKPEGFHRYSS